MQETAKPAKVPPVPTAQQMVSNVASSGVKISVQPFTANALVPPSGKTYNVPCEFFNPKTVLLSSFWRYSSLETKKSCIPFRWHVARVGLSGLCANSSPRTIPIVAMPWFAPTAATAARWLEKAPPKVSNAFASDALNAARLYFSLRHLFPEASGKTISSRFRCTEIFAEANVAKSNFWFIG